MIAYFKRQSNLFMAAGALLGLIFTALAYHNVMRPHAVLLRAFLMMIPVLLGVIIGRVAASRWATAKMKQITMLLYQDGNPAAFLSAFEPIARLVPPNTAEYFDAHVKMGFAYEALGQFDDGLRELEGLDPNTLKLHGLSSRAAICNQRARLLLLKSDSEQAKPVIDEMLVLRDAANHRAPTLGKQLGNCIDLFMIWMGVNDKQNVDTDYLQEEINLANNRIHKSEMQLLLARARQNEGADEAAEELLRAAMDTGEGLYAGEKASELLSRLSEYSYISRASNLN